MVLRKAKPPENAGTREARRPARRPAAGGGVRPTCALLVLVDDGADHGHTVGGALDGCRPVQG